MIVWGGTGGIYDPASDSWTVVTPVGAPSPRYWHTATWTGSTMAVWGGLANFADNGARYSPDTNTWQPMSGVDAPPLRYLHSAVWTGDSIIYWGGDSDTAAAYRSGGRYFAAPAVDDDHDGVTICGGDCDDTNPAVHPAAEEVCNSIDDDCDFVADDGIAVPNGIPALFETKSGSDAQITWSAVGGVTGYDVVAGSLGLLRGGAGDFTSSTATCLGHFPSPVPVDDASTPAPGDARWHLVRPVNSCAGPGTYDDGSQAQGRDAEIAAAGAACP
jgi:hypothetical protein